MKRCTKLANIAWALPLALSLTLSAAAAVAAPGGLAPADSCEMLINRPDIAPLPTPETIQSACWAFDIENRA